MNAQSLDADACYRALAARDARFDGLFFVGVTTTGIYCRPVCRARTPGRTRCVFFPSAAVAEKDGFRACFRCRPELAPGGAPMEATSRIVRLAVARIEQGGLGDDGVDALAAELGVSSRHLRRAVRSELGVSPIELAQTRRLAVAKQLLQDTSCSITEVAHASGFGSLRRFNAAFLERFGRPPSAVRRASTRETAAADALVVTLAYRPPFDWASLLGFLRMRATPGVEVVTAERYARTVKIGAASGWVSVVADEGGGALRAELASTLAPVLMPLVARLRRLFDLDAHPVTVAEHLRKDRVLRPLVARRPGLRVPGAFDVFELVVRAVLGQQVSVAAGTTLAGRLAASFGEAIATPHEGLARSFPSAEQLARASEAELAAIGLPGARARTLSNVARAVVEGALRLDGPLDPGAFSEALERLPGIGPWTTSYVAMRALGAPDAFPEGDLVLRKTLGVSSSREALARAEPWRPWRAYAALHLWTASPGDEP